MNRPVKKFGPKFRRIVVTDEQLLVFRASNKFPDDPPNKKPKPIKGYLKVINALFEKQHRCRVENFDKLRFERHLDKSTENPRLITIVEGDIGHALVEM